MLTQHALALLSREHVLMTGPPGTAKSQMAAAVLRRIVDERTGEPSYFARQFTENTVQTDLVGPLDFKTLMESGRTEHFTDEGMLGAVHAFLDEVFDGRDMLLRSTLNLLQERELKQGSRTTTGRIECAFMTSNRYIAEILESSRETLLAFVDRVAFVSFVPRGFAEPKNFALVVRRHGGGFGRHRLTAPLSIQDLDVLQSAAERTYVPDAICNALARLIGDLDIELAAAMRADPAFQPTRYLSTRTAVRAAHVLRAVVVLDKIRGRPDRPFQVDFDDLDGLRHHLLLAGLPRDKIAARMDLETDPRERRQLDIMRTEAEIFDRCLAKLPRVEVPKTPPSVDLAGLGSMADAARSSRDPDKLVAAAKELLSASESGASGSDRAASLLSATVATLSERALRAGLAPALRPGTPVAALASELAAAADNLERAAGTGRPMARWLRGRLIWLLDQSLGLAPATVAGAEAAAPEMASDALIAALVSDPVPEALRAHSEDRLRALEEIAALRQKLLAQGAWLGDPEGSDNAWQRALRRLEDDLVLIWDAIFRATAQEILSEANEHPLGNVLAKLGPAMTDIGKVGARIAKLGAESQIERRVVGPRVEPLVAAAFERMETRDRRSAIDEAVGVVETLESAGLDAVIEPSRFVARVVPALLRHERTREGEPRSIANLSDFEKARSDEDPLSLTETLIEIATRVAPPAALEPEHPRAATEAVYTIVRGIDEHLSAEVARLDVARIERGLARLEIWWSSFAERAAAATRDASETVTLLEQVVGSGLLRVLRGQAEPVRLALEAKNLAQVLPSTGDRARRLEERIERLDATITEHLTSLLQGHAARAWQATLGGDTDQPT